MTTNVEKKLKANVIDDVKYTRKETKLAKINLVVCLWGPFITALIILMLCTRGVIG